MPRHRVDSTVVERRDAIVALVLAAQEGSSVGGSSTMILASGGDPLPQSGRGSASARCTCCGRCLVKAKESRARRAAASNPVLSASSCADS
jgi:hypothetical protein